MSWQRASFHGAPKRTVCRSATSPRPPARCRALGLRATGLHALWVCLLVRRYLAARGEALDAAVARVRLDARAGLAVGCHVAPSPERRRAHRAFVWLVAGVDRRVLAQAALGRELRRSSGFLPLLLAATRSPTAPGVVAASTMLRNVPLVARSRFRASGSCCRRFGSVLKVRKFRWRFCKIPVKGRHGFHGAGGAWSGKGPTCRDAGRLCSSGWPSVSEVDRRPPHVLVQCLPTRASRSGELRNNDTWAGDLRAARPSGQQAPAAQPTGLPPTFSSLVRGLTRRSASWGAGAASSMFTVQAKTVQFSAENVLREGKETNRSLGDWVTEIWAPLLLRYKARCSRPRDG